MTSRIIECMPDQRTKQTDFSDAMRTLTGTGFKLYSYLWNMAELENGRSVFQLCEKDACIATGIAHRTYYDAVKELTDRGFIKPKEGKQRYFIFNGKGT